MLGDQSEDPGECVRVALVGALQDRLAQPLLALCGEQQALDHSPRLGAVGAELAPSRSSRSVIARSTLASA